MTSFFGIKVCDFCAFLKNDKTDLRQFFFQDLREFEEAFGGTKL